MVENININKPRLMFFLLAAVLLVGSLLSTVAQAQRVQDRVLSRVRISEIEECAVATIWFNFPVQVKSSFPKNQGDHVRIDLRPIDAGRTDGGAIRSREELRPPSSRKAGIQEIQYDGDAPTGPVLTITFNRNRYFAIDQGADFRSLDINIAEIPIEDACSGNAPRLRTGPDVDGPKKDREIQSVLHSMPDVIDANAVYALNLVSQQSLIEKADLLSLPAFSKYAAYVTRFEEDGVVWNRLRLGFFETRTQAQALAEAIKSTYPDAWIVRTSREERETVYQAWLSERKAAKRNVALIQRSDPVEQLPTNTNAASLVLEARTLMAEGNNARAIQLLTKALTLAENIATPDTRELLGLARQKNGQLAHAKAEYEEYLQRYPENEGAPRVRQRLSALLTEGKDAPPELREGTGGRAGKYVTRLTASLSQYYQRDESTVTLEQPDFTPDPDKQVNRNALISGADITASVSNDRFDASLRFSGSHTKDFEEDGRGDSGTISALYIDVADSGIGLAARVGRQTRSTGGVLGRFDGGLISIDASDKIRVNVVGGAPVLRSRDLFIDNSRRFVGASVDVSQVVDGLDATVYFIHQKVDDLIDRQAAGFELRYVDDKRSAYGLFDYDTFYDTLNLALFNGTWRLEDNTTFNIAFDYRYSPILLTIDALQGQGVETIDELRARFTDDDLYFLAESRAARSKTGSFTVSHPLSEKFQFNAGVTFANISATPDAGGVMGQPSTGVEAFYSAQILATSLLMDGDLTTVGFRYDDLSSGGRYVIDLNTRYPISRKLRIAPRMRLGQRKSKIAEQTQYTVKPSIRINYIPARLFQLELEVGGEWTNTKNVLDSELVKGYYFIAGYRLDL